MLFDWISGYRQRQDAGLLCSLHLACQGTPALLLSTSHSCWAHLNCLRLCPLFKRVCACCSQSVCVCVTLSVARQRVGVRYMVLRLLILLWHRTPSHSLAEERSSAQRQAEGLFIDHFWPTWQQEGDEDKERNYGGQGGAKHKIGHPTRAKERLLLWL